MSLTCQGDPGYEEPARQAATVPEANHRPHRPREGDCEGMSSQGRYRQGKASAEEEEVPGGSLIQDRCPTSAAGDPHQRRRVRPGAEGCLVWSAAGNGSSQGDPQGNGRHRECREAAG